MFIVSVLGGLAANAVLDRSKKTLQNMTKTGSIHNLSHE